MYIYIYILFYVLKVCVCVYMHTSYTIYYVVNSVIGLRVANVPTDT